FFPRRPFCAWRHRDDTSVPACETSCGFHPRWPFSEHRVSRNNLETVPAFTLKLVPWGSSRNFLNHARPGEIHRDHRCDYDARRTGNVERVCAEMAGTLAGRYPDRARTFGILFPNRHLRHPQHCSKLAVVDLLNLPTLKRREEGHALPKLRETNHRLVSFRTKCFWSAMRRRIAFKIWV